VEDEKESTTFRRPAIDESEEKNLSYQRKLPHDVAHLRERSGRGADDDLRALRRGGERVCVSGNREAGVRRNDCHRRRRLAKEIEQMVSWVARTSRLPSPFIAAGWLRCSSKGQGQSQPASSEGQSQPASSEGDRASSERPKD